MIAYDLLHIPLPKAVHVLADVVDDGDVDHVYQTVVEGEAGEILVGHTLYAVEKDPGDAALHGYLLGLREDIGLRRTGFVVPKNVLYNIIKPPIPQTGGLISIILFSFRSYVDENSFFLIGRINCLYKSLFE